jgi:hypothetical protein
VEFTLENKKFPNFLLLKEKDKICGGIKTTAAGR